MSTDTIRVVIGSNIKREAVLINPAISAAEPSFNTESPAAQIEAPNNVIATGENSRQILKRFYGR
jgi:hypothetical protein